jgi:hypothetical protein
MLSQIIKLKRRATREGLMMRMELEDNDSQLFLVRLWRDGDDATQADLHGRVQHILSGTAQSFEEWPALIDFLLDPFFNNPPQAQLKVDALTNNAKRE